MNQKQKNEAGTHEKDAVWTEKKYINLQTKQCTGRIAIVVQEISTVFFFILTFFFYMSVLSFFFPPRDRASLYSSGCPGTHFVDQAGLELRNPPASASHVLGLKA
jgi:hypothetical protein